MSKEKGKISDQVLNKIKKQKVKPIPKWHFVLQHGFLWILLVILLLLGAITLGITFFELSDVEWGLRPLLGIGLFGLFLKVFPYFWIFVLIIISLLAYYNFINTPKGYRYPKYQVILFGLLLIILTAAAFHYGGLAKNTRNFLHEQAPFLRPFMFDKEHFYNMPDNGLLVGKIVEINDDYLVVKTFDGSNWQVNITQAQLPPGKIIDEGQKVKIIGEKTAENEFSATEFRPWQTGDKLRLHDKPPETEGGMGHKKGQGQVNF